MTPRHIAAIALLLVTAGVPRPVAGTFNQAGPPQATPPAIVAGELVVQLRAAPAAAESRGTTGTASGSPLETLRGRYGLGAAEPVFPGLHTAPQQRRSLLGGTPGPGATVPDLSRIYLVHVDANADIPDLVANLQRDPSVEWAEPNYVYHADVLRAGSEAPRYPSQRAAAAEAPLPNDPFLSSSGSWGQLFPDLWGLFKIEAPAAWQLSQGEGVVVAVVDTGIDIEHEDLAANVWHNPGEIPANGIDDDGNGFIDDANGWDFTRCAERNGKGICVEAKEPGPDVSDQFGHGTHVAGIIAAVGDNGIGIIGIAPRAHIMAVKALDEAGFGRATDLAAALVYAADNGTEVINASWGGAQSNTIRTAVEYVTARGVVMVVSAGNDALPIEAGTSPADLPEVIAVGALTHTDSNAFFSNFGGPLALVAPGGGDVEPASAARPWNSVLSLWAHDSTLGKECYDELRCTPEDFWSENCGDDLVEVCAVAPWAVGDHYLRLAGTSMAAPHVSGVAALVRSRHPEFTGEQVQQVLLNTADDLGAAGWDPTFGYGRVNAQRAVAVDAIPVAEITTPRNRAKVWDWQFPLSIEGNAVSPGVPMRAWRLALREQDTGQVTPVAGGDMQVTEGVLGTLELAQVQPGKWYVLELTVEDVAGNTAADTKTFLVPNPLFGVIPFPDSVGAQNLTLSADGTRVALTDTSDVFGGVWLYDTLTRDLRRVATGFGVMSGWLTPDGHLLSYAGFLPDGTDCHPPLTVPTTVFYDIDAASYTCAALLPLNLKLGPMDARGQRMAFTAPYSLDPSVTDQDRSWEAFLYDLGAQSIRQITEGPPGPYDGGRPEVENLSMSSDGTRLAFDADVDLDATASTGGTRQVFLYEDSAKTVRQLTGRPGTPPYGMCPSLSGDGSRVAYRSADGLMVEDLQADAVRGIIDDRGGPSCPHLSADGSRIAFTAAADLDPTVENEDLSPEVFLVDLTTGVARQVTDTRFPPWCRPNVGDVCWPLVAGISATGDILLANNNGAISNGLPVPLDLFVVRLVRRQPNRPPALEVPGMITAPVNVTTNAALRATDPDGFPITFFVQLTSGLSQHPRWVLSDHADGTADLAFTPRLSDAGTSYTLRIAAFNEAGGVAEQDIQLVILSTTPTPNWPATLAARTPTATRITTATATLAPTPTLTPSATQTSMPTASSTVAPTTTPTRAPTPTATLVPFATQIPTPTASSTITSTTTRDLRPIRPGDGGCAIGPVGSDLGEELFLLVLPAVLLARRARTGKPEGRERASRRRGDRPVAPTTVGIMTVTRRSVGRWRDSITARLSGALALLATMTAMVCSPHIAAATDIVPTSTEDTLDSRECTLRAAVTASNTQIATAACRAGSGNDTIILAPAATYTLTQVGDGTDDPSGLAVTGTLAITGSGATIERSSVAGTPAFRVFWVAPDATLVLNDVTIANGKTPDFAWGGGISNAGTLTLANSAVIASVGSRAGGGIFNSGTLTVLNSAILLNTTGDSILAANGTRILGGEGGGVFNAGTSTLIDSVVSDNATGRGGAGGGLYNSGVLRLIGTVTRGNRTGAGLAGEFNGGVGGSGGGIKNAYTGTLTLSKSAVSSNVTGTGGVAGDAGRAGTGGRGGGLANDSILSVTASVISDNATGDGGAGGGGGAGGDGGGIANADTVTVVSSTVSGNVTGDGGAGVVGSGSGGGGGGIFNPLSGTLTVVNSTVSGNGTGSGGCCGGFDSGGGIANAGTFTLASSTVSDNTAGPNRGGGIANFSSGTFITENSIIAGNSAASDSDCTGTLTSEGYNLIEDVAGCTLAGGNGNVVGQDPRLGPLRNNGGPTFTHALLAGSPAIDAGDPAGCTNANGAVLTRDQRGAARERAGDARCDIGSYEFGATVLPLCMGDCNQDGMVTVDEILMGVDIALGGLPPAACPALTANGNDTVTIDEILQAVNSALDGCS